MEPSFISKTGKFWVEYVLTTKTSYKNAVFSHSCLLQLLEPVFFYIALVSTFCLVYFLSKKVPVESTLSSLKIADKAGTQTPGYLW
jgi:hypothetical protein